MVDILETFLPESPTFFFLNPPLVRTGSHDHP